MASRYYTITSIKGYKCIYCSAHNNGSQAAITVLVTFAARVVIVVTILSQVLKATNVSTVVPANNGSQVVAVTVLITSGSKQL
ncbi:MAG: hypothetical protein R2728_08075 [Chitinophagales bacterium]